MYLQENIFFKDLTTVGIGGPARYFINAQTKEELVEAVTFAKKEGLPYLVIGGASNLLVSDEGFDGVVIQVGHAGIKQAGGQLIVQAGTPLQQLVDYTIEQGLDGMSTMTGIPGSVGGAVYGSAGAYGDNIRDYLQEVVCFNGEKLVTITKKEYSTGYRDSIFKQSKNLFILEAIFSGLPQADAKELKKEATQILEIRLKKYPFINSPGSFFKNVFFSELTASQQEKIKESLIQANKDPEQILKYGKVPAGVLIEILGGLGDQLGQIKVADNHGNTFMNLGGGTAKDFWALAKKWHDKVKEEFGVELEPEVQMINLPKFNP